MSRFKSKFTNSYKYKGTPPKRLESWKEFRDKVIPFYYENGLYDTMVRFKITGQAISKMLNSIQIENSKNIRNQF